MRSEAVSEGPWSIWWTMPGEPTDRVGVLFYWVGHRLACARANERRLATWKLCEGLSGLESRRITLNITDDPSTSLLRHQAWMQIPFAAALSHTSSGDCQTMCLIVLLERSVPSSKNYAEQDTYLDKTASMLASLQQVRSRLITESLITPCENFRHIICCS